MGQEKIQKVTITSEQTREAYDQGPDAVEALVFSLVDTIDVLIDKVEDQSIRIIKLEDQFNKNSRNSSKPPSTDSPFKNKDKKKKTQNPVQKRSVKVRL
ncbi:hypothetical protein EW093_10955 [Thiospirochaeta perfilievii]|uniref:DUF6444 domain-containing protein n=1 Tax=Thiospirochaeta perfilievii TaxID=252967 RepID=A0A5C1QCS5_9SPIO|nr:DUF6444 domain-containing protein [Thiospirochaeta perfilievii]QEN05207.1 hypothetical protein EW093_10955 [Thiospirochaeta perfilievii]